MGCGGKGSMVQVEGVHKAEELPEQVSVNINTVGSPVLKGLSQFVGLVPLHLRLFQGEVETGPPEELIATHCFL